MRRTAGELQHRMADRARLATPFRYFPSLFDRTGHTTLIPSSVTGVRAPAAESFAHKLRGHPNSRLHCVVSIMNTSLERAALWRVHAKEYRTLAGMVKNFAIQTSYRDLAGTYESLAD